MRRSGGSSSPSAPSSTGRIDKEIRIKKFTAAELDEEEQNLERLRRWHRDLRRRDVFVAPSQEEADRRLKECEQRLEGFAEQVFAYGGEA